MQLFEIILIAAGASLLALSVWLGGKRKSNPEPPPREQSPAELSPEATSKLQTSLIELLRELHTLSNDMSVDLEERLTELKDVLQLADKKLEEMSIAGIKEKPEIEQAPKPPEKTPPPASAPEVEPEPTAEQDDVSPSLGGRYGEIYQMEDQGLPINEIARRMQMGKGEIQLILGLREKD